MSHIPLRMAHLVSYERSCSCMPTSRVFEGVIVLCLCSVEVLLALHPADVLFVLLEANRDHIMIAYLEMILSQITLANVPHLRTLPPPSTFGYVVRRTSNWLPAHMMHPACSAVSHTPGKSSRAHSGKGSLEFTT